MKQIASALGTINWAKSAGFLALCAITAIALPAQTFTTLHSFDLTDGGYAYAGLVQATNGDLYGTTVYGGADGFGTIFKINPSGTLTTLYSFCSQSGCTDGSEPFTGLIQATNGNFYGTTRNGGLDGAYGLGTIFKVTPGGTLTTLHSFGSQSLDGQEPLAGLVQASNGDFYGTAYSGGAYQGSGTVFKITPSGTLTTLYSFCAQSACSDGAGPTAGLVRATNGDFYGTTDYGGTSDSGTVFKITPGGVLTTLHSFCASGGSCADGQHPDAGLVQASNGEIFGTTYEGGPGGAGTVFKITPSGTLTTIYAFCATFVCTAGAFPASDLIQAGDGNLYGTTLYGGSSNDGTIFKITPNGTLTTLHSFCAQSGCADGTYPYASLVQKTNGEFYGTTSAGGANNDGTVFSLSVGLGPFVKTLPTFGEVGAAVKILGSDLTGAASVSFNGTAATFSVVSRYLITTTVPAGATTGNVEVTTPGGTLRTLNVSFQVLP
jgi:uncharacterized repeat protein (TIGR03803 family)